MTRHISASRAVLYTSAVCLKLSPTVFFNDCLVVVVSLSQFHVAPGHNGMNDPVSWRVLFISVSRFYVGHYMSQASSTVTNSTTQG